MVKKPESWKPKIKIWDGTNVHGSYDTLVGAQLTDMLKLMGFNAEHKGQWSFEDLHNGKIAFVTHPRRLASINPYTVSQRDAEKFILQMFKGALPKNICMTVCAHGHTTRGSIDDDPFRVINLPAWTTFIEYQKALANFPHFQPDIGAYFIIITKDGRVHTQKWLYKPFVYNHLEGKIYEEETGTPEEEAKKKKFVPEDKVVVENYLLEMLRDAKFVVVAIADFHIGEVYSVAPPKYTLGGREYDLSSDLTEANKKIYRYWQNFVEVCKLIKPHEIWIVGDALGGATIFEKNRIVLKSTLEEQKAMFAELFKLFL